jgi:hypothetical protein
MVAMNPIKPALFLLLLSASLLAAVQASAKTILPDACGDDGVKFDVKTQKDQPAPAPPEAGKAQIVLIGTIDKEGAGTCIACNFVGRVGVDGAWVGANKGASYFAYTVEPGEHHVCANWQTIGQDGKKVGVASFTAEPGKAYYFRVAITIQPYTTDRGAQKEDRLDLTQLSEDEGKYRVKVSALSTATPKK